MDLFVNMYIVHTALDPITNENLLFIDILQCLGKFKIYFYNR